ncbi:GNAT family protein [Lentibacillus sp. L22]|uniref:GNAT family N-acetyltransferase n=1 Tax=Lentibacillus TaxID=175304 RepID=UPI0022B15658|nr:GNAT family protein [Lentibacillus daqui]
MFYQEVDEEITLKLLVLTDAEALFSLTDQFRDNLRKWLSWVDKTETVDDSRAFIEYTLQQYSEKTGLTAAVMYRGQLAGTVSFNSFDWTNRIGYIGYWLADSFQGKGIMTRSCRALVEHGFTELALNRIDIRAAYENQKSRAIPERLGFVEEGLLRQTEWLYDHYVDHVVYGMLADEWQTEEMKQQHETSEEHVPTDESEESGEPLE